MASSNSAFHWSNRPFRHLLGCLLCRIFFPWEFGYTRVRPSNVVAVALFQAMALLLLLNTGCRSVHKLVVCVLSVRLTYPPHRDDGIFLNDQSCVSYHVGREHLNSAILSEFRCPAQDPILYHVLFFGFLGTTNSCFVLFFTMSVIGLCPMGIIGKKPFKLLLQIPKRSGKVVMVP